ncbi:Uncharacterised protein [Shigella flexneri]|nr:Uncharacterised protein [Shigella flexneri]
MFGATEARAHHNGFIVVLLIVVVDIAHRFNARIFFHHIRVHRLACLIPVINTPYKRRNQKNACFRTGPRLGKRKQQRQVAVNTFFFQLFGRANSFPGRSQFDQNA